MNQKTNHIRLKPAFKALPLRTWATAALLATAASASHAGATVSIDYFGASSQTGYVWTVEAYQRFQSDALQAGGVAGSDSASRSTANWDQGSNTSAQVANAQATGLLTQQIETWPQYLLTPLFNLSAITQRGVAYGAPVSPHQANANGEVGGGFTLIDFNGDALAGDITFTLYYTINVSSIGGAAATDYAQALLGIDAFDGDESYDNTVQALSSDFSTGASGDISGILTWTFNLVAGEVAAFSIAGSAISSSDVPEPGVLALAAAALVGAGVGRRRTCRPADGVTAAA